METRLIIAYCLIALLLAAGALFISQAYLRRRRHREIMRGSRRFN